MTGLYRISMAMIYLLTRINTLMGVLSMYVCSRQTDGDVMLFNINMKDKMYSSSQLMLNVVGGAFRFRGDDVRCYF